MESLSEADKLFIMVGRCLTAWNRVEEGILNLIEYACTRQDNMVDEIAYGYWSVVSFEARLKWCAAIVNMRTTDPGYEAINAEWNTLQSYLSKKAQKRAEIAHGSVVELSGYLPGFYAFFQKHASIYANERQKNIITSKFPSFQQNHKPLSVSELTDRENSFAEAEKRVFNFGAAWRLKDTELEHPSQGY